MAPLRKEPATRPAPSGQEPAIPPPPEPPQGEAVNVPADFQHICHQTGEWRTIALQIGGKTDALPFAEHRNTVVADCPA